MPIERQPLASEGRVISRWIRLDLLYRPVVSDRKSDRRERRNLCFFSVESPEMETPIERQPLASESRVVSCWIHLDLLYHPVVSDRKSERRERRNVHPYSRFSPRATYI